MAKDGRLDVISKINWVISAEESGIKLQAFLKGKLGQEVSARQIKQLIDAGSCQINGRVERFSSRLVGRGDRIAFYKPEATIKISSPTLISFDSPDRVLYMDNELVVYDKPAGFSSEDPRLLSFIKSYEAAHAAMPNVLSESHAQLVHRLDRDTTGVLVFARNKAAAEVMLALFKQRQIKKTYLAIVDGVPECSQGVIDNFLGKISTYQGQTLYGEMSKEKGGLWARTVWEKKRSGQESSLVVCYPETGRTHQLRVHLSSLGHPILGDHQYGRSFMCPFRPQRMLLHAHEIAFENPVTKLPIKIVAKLPADFTEAESLLIKQRQV